MLLQLILGTAQGAVIPEGNEILLTVFKFFFIVGAAMYTVFAFVVIRQIHVMRTTLITTFSPVLKTIGIIHFVIAVSVLLLYLVVL